MWLWVDRSYLVYFNNIIIGGCKMIICADCPYLYDCEGNDDCPFLEEYEDDEDDEDVY